MVFQLFFTMFPKTPRVSIFGSQNRRPILAKSVMGAFSASGLFEKRPLRPPFSPQMSSKTMTPCPPDASLDRSWCRLRPKDVFLLSWGSFGATLEGSGTNLAWFSKVVPRFLAISSEKSQTANPPTNNATNPGVKCTNYPDTISNDSMIRVQSLTA